MSIKQLNPYLNFNGTAEQAIRLYESVLGATTEGLMRWGDMPGATVPAEQKDRVMHALLHLGASTLMISDVPSSAPAPSASNVHVCLHFDDVADMTSRFERLAKDGTITHPLQDTFWGARFGMLTDAFGVRWMFNCEHNQA